MLEVVILAAGKGTRMRSNTPKVLQTLAGKSFLQHVVDRSHELDADKIHLVVGHGARQVKSTFGVKYQYIEQTEQLGTGHAVQMALPHLHASSTTLILYGDVPLISTPTLKSLLTQVSDNAMALLTVNVDNPQGYGRIVRDAKNAVTAIVEQKDANHEQALISEVNTGVMAVKTVDLARWLPLLTNDNVQREYLLTDVIALAHGEGKTINTAQPENSFEVLGVNNRQQQAELERLYQSLYAETLMAEGVMLLDPARFDCRGSLKAGRDCVIDVNCIFEGDCVIGDNVQIGPNCHFIDAKIGSGVAIKSNTIIEKARIENDAVVGPFARLRPDTNLKQGAKVGNFVEIKKSTIGEGSKVNHLSYIGDADIGKDVNIGAGTITCNYDGKNKYKTEISNGVFVGSNSSLVAPVTLGENVTIGAGSVITSDVQDNALAVARSRQRDIPGWASFKKKH